MPRATRVEQMLTGQGARQGKLVRHGDKNKLMVDVMFVRAPCWTEGRMVGGASTLVKVEREPPAYGRDGCRYR